jgi:hypothetical protein
MLRDYRVGLYVHAPVYMAGKKQKARTFPLQPSTPFHVLLMVVGTIHTCDQHIRLRVHTLRDAGRQTYDAATVVPHHSAIVNHSAYSWCPLESGLEVSCCTTVPPGGSVQTVCFVAMST